MAKPATQYSCQACGAVAARWLGRCTGCGAWNTLVEEATPRGAGRSAHARAADVRSVADIDLDHAARIPTGIGELDRVLGGGAVLGAVTLVGGDPGVGKSTLLMQALAGLARAGHRCLYVSGEESASQTAARARRLGAMTDELLVLAETDLDTVERALGEVKPTAVVVEVLDKTSLTLCFELAVRQWRRLDVSLSSKASLHQDVKLLQRARA